MIDLVLRESKKLRKEFSNITIIEDIYRLIKEEYIKISREALMIKQGITFWQAE